MSGAGPHQLRVSARTYAISARMEDRMKTAATAGWICSAVS